jgi:hypothetical protein
VGRKKEGEEMAEGLYGRQAARSRATAAGSTEEVKVAVILVLELREIGRTAVQPHFTQGW